MLPSRVIDGLIIINLFFHHQIIRDRTLYNCFLHWSKEDVDRTFGPGSLYYNPKHHHFVHMGIHYDPYTFERSPLRIYRVCPSYVPGQPFSYTYLCLNQYGNRSYFQNARPFPYYDCY